MEKIYKQLEETGIIPVVVLENVQDAVPLAKALSEGNLPAAEVTFRTAAAKEAIRAMKKACPDMLLGAGTVLSCSQVDEALEAGAQFIVSPGLDEEVVSYCIEKQVPVLPGTCTPSDVQKAYKLGLRIVKFFPAETAGGLKMIQAIAAPYPMMRFMPTGGINENNMESYLKDKRILCIGGTWMVSKDLIARNDFDEIARLCRQAAKKKEMVRGL